MNKVSPLDPTRGITKPELESARHKPLAEEYIWTANAANADAKLVYTFPGVMERTEPHYFGELQRGGGAEGGDAVPGGAAKGEGVDQRADGRGGGERCDVAAGDACVCDGGGAVLKTGRNVIAIEAVRGRGVTGFANSALVRQQTFGQVMVAKIVPAGRSGGGCAGVDAEREGLEEFGNGGEGVGEAGFDDAEMARGCRAWAGSRARLSCFSGTRMRGCMTGRGMTGSRGFWRI